MRHKHSSALHVEVTRMLLQQKLLVSASMEDSFQRGAPHLHSCQHSAAQDLQSKALMLLAKVKASSGLFWLTTTFELASRIKIEMLSSLLPGETSRVNGLQTLRDQNLLFISSFRNLNSDAYRHFCPLESLHHSWIPSSMHHSESLSILQPGPNLNHEVYGGS